MDSTGRSEPLLELRGARKVYGAGEAEVHALDGVDLSISEGEFLAITGASGSGKSTALSVLGCLELLSAGEYRIEGIEVQSLEPDVLAALRNERFGFVFQSYNLLARTSALDNVALPLVYAGLPAAERRRRALAALAQVGLEGRELARPNQLSGGQQQRVAIARALVNSPAVFLADEPTGNLDSKMGAEIMQLIRRLNDELGITVLMVTHDASCAAWARRQVVFKDGRIARDEKRAA
jgi:putative ABC transport system ATP-binding protein